MKFDFTGMTYGDLILLQTGVPFYVYPVLNKYCDVDLLSVAVDDKEMQSAIEDAFDRFENPIPDVFDEIDI